MKLLIQPGDGLGPLLKGIDGAKTSVEITIFRLDRTEIERALANAVKRGVFVHALIANTNRMGQAALRKLELRLLAAGATVARTADDLIRYHDKFMIIDRRVLYLLAFNFTYLDIESSRSFGIITTNAALVREAGKLFDADTRRHAYEPGSPAFVVSPINARRQLSSFLEGAKKELLIYDPTVSDPGMIRLLEQRSEAGVHIRILGRLTSRSPHISAHKTHTRLHARTIIRDGVHIFIGSQSLREIELDQRREVGITVRDRHIASRIAKVFEEDWHVAEQAKHAAGAKDETAPADRVAKKVAKVVAKQLPPVAPVLDGIIKEMGRNQPEVDLSVQEMEESVKDAVKTAVKEAVKDALEESVAQEMIHHRA